MMKSWKTQLRMVGLIVLLNLVPFLRGCNDVEGLHETTGFPAPDFRFSSSSFDLINFDAGVLGLNVALLYGALCLLLMRAPATADIILDEWFHFSVIAVGIALKFGNVYLFLPLGFVTIVLCHVFGDAAATPTMDILARCFFVCILAVPFAIFRSLLRKESNNADRSMDDNDSN